jgi:hypothetical protein
MDTATLPPSLLAKSEFRNDSGSILGVIVIDGGREKALPVAPGDTILLSAEEQMATANAPKLEKDNPFGNGALTLKTAARDIATRRQIGDPTTLGGPTPEIADSKPATQDTSPEAKAKAEAEAERAKEAAKQGAAGAKPQGRPPAKTEGQGAELDERAAEQQESATKGKRSPDEEVGTDTKGK